MNAPDRIYYVRDEMLRYLSTTRRHDSDDEYILATTHAATVERLERLERLEKAAKQYLETHSLVDQMALMMIIDDKDALKREVEGS